MSKWIKVCTAEDVSENKIKRFSVGDFDIVIANYGDGLRAFPPVCPHMREPLDESGLLNNGVLTCGKHVWQWDLRSCTKASTMTEERNTKLTELGFVWKVRERADWNDRYEQLLEFKKEVSIQLV